MKNLRKLREEAKLSQQNLAEQLCLSQQSIFKYEHDQAEPDFATLIALANLFHTSIDYLIGYTDNSTPSNFNISIDLSVSERMHLAAYRKLDDAYARSIDELINQYLNKK